MRYQGETDKQKEQREAEAYTELKSHEARLKEVWQQSTPEFREFLEWMIDVYAAEQCGRLKGPYPFLVRGTYPREEAVA